MNRQTPQPQGTIHIQPYRLPRALWIALASAAILSIVMVLGATSRTNLQIEPHFNTLYVCIANLFIFLILYPLNFWILRFSLKTSHRVALCLIASLSLATIFTLASYQIEILLDPNGFTSNPFHLNLIANLAAGLISFLVSILINNITEHQRILLENQQLQSENLLIRHQTLQQQLSPHFLFNSLNTLDGLIGTDDPSAHQYLPQLAATFRYSMQKQTEVTLADELEFTQSYIYMMQIRHGNNLHVLQHIDNDLLSTHVVPISLQLLVENAIKHNIVSQRYPLTISISTTPHRTLIVSNPLRPKADSQTTGGTGLTNLAQRYRLLCQKDIKITRDDTTFTVEIPLI